MRIGSTWRSLFSFIQPPSDCFKQCVPEGLVIRAWSGTEHTCQRDITRGANTVWHIVTVTNRKPYPLSVTCEGTLPEGLRYVLFRPTPRATGILRGALGKLRRWSLRENWKDTRANLENGNTATFKAATLCWLHPGCEAVRATVKGDWPEIGQPLVAPPLEFSITCS